MNAPTAARETARRAARFNLWAAIAVIAALGVFTVKAAVETSHTPSRHFEPNSSRETPIDRWWADAVDKP